MPLQARDMLADTLGYWSYENRSLDSGRVIAQAKGGKVNRFNMCADQTFFPPSPLSLNVTQNRTFSNPVVKKRKEFRQRRTLSTQAHTLSKWERPWSPLFRESKHRKLTFYQPCCALHERRTFLLSECFCSTAMKMKMKNGLKRSSPCVVWLRPGCVDLISDSFKWPKNNKPTRISAILSRLLSDHHLSSLTHELRLHIWQRREKLERKHVE